MLPIYEWDALIHSSRVGWRAPTHASREGRMGGGAEKQTSSHRESRKRRRGRHGFCESSRFFVLREVRLEHTHHHSLFRRVQGPVLFSDARSILRPAHRGRQKAIHDVEYALTSEARRKLEQVKYRGYFWVATRSSSPSSHSVGKNV